MAVLTAPPRSAATPSGSASAGSSSSDRGAGFGAALAAAGSESAATETATGLTPTDVGIPASGDGSADTGAEPQSEGSALATVPPPADTQRPTTITPGWGEFPGFAWNVNGAGAPVAPATAGTSGTAIVSDAAPDVAIPGGPAAAATASALTDATSTPTATAPVTRARGEVGALQQASPVATTPVPDSAVPTAQQLGAAQPPAAPRASIAPTPATTATAAAIAVGTAGRTTPTVAPPPVAAGTPADEPVPAEAARPNALPIGAAPATQSSSPIAAAQAPVRPAAASQHAPLATQLARPLLTLAHAGDGSHSITITVAPDRLGPVTVQAVVTGDQLRVELFAPTDLARDAVRGVLGELRRDLAATGIHATLGLSADDAPAKHGQGQNGQGQNGQNQNGQNGALGQSGGQTGREPRPGEQPPAAQPGTLPGADATQPAEATAQLPLGAASAHPHIDLIA